MIDQYYIIGGLLLSEKGETDISTSIWHLQCQQVRLIIKTKRLRCHLIVQLIVHKNRLYICEDKRTKQKNETRSVDSQGRKWNERSSEFTDRPLAMYWISPEGAFVRNQFAISFFWSLPSASGSSVSSSSAIFDEEEGEICFILRLTSRSQNLLIL